MENKFKVGQKVRIVPKAQLVELEHNGADLPEYKLNIDEGEWVWYENLLEPIE